MNLWWVKILLILGAVFVFAKWGPGIPITSVVTQKQDLFTVTGEGKVTVVPDTAVVNLGITANHSTIKAAQTQANTVINKITEELKKLGIESTDIKTSNYSVYPQYNYDGGPSRITGYQVNASLTITVRDFDKVNQVIDTSTANGANTVGGIQLTVDEKRQKELLQQARELAVKEAKTKAESLARTAGITLGKIVNIQEGYSNPGPVYAKEMMAAVGGGGDTQIQPGSTDITSSVTLFYETR